MAIATIPAPPVRLLLQDFEIDEAEARLTMGGRAITLPPRSFSVLCVLARTPGTLVRKCDLLDAVWGDQCVMESVLKSAISTVRAALGDDARQPRWIETVSRRGYRFIGGPPAVDGAQQVDREGWLPALEALGALCARDPALTEFLCKLAFGRAPDPGRLTLESNFKSALQGEDTVVPALGYTLHRTASNAAFARTQ